MKLAEKRELKYMEAELFKATVRGDVRILSKTSVVNHGEPYFLSRSPHENNIIHIATEHGHLNFIDKALDLFPFLVHQKNKNGDTSLHIAARKGNTETIKLLISVLDQIAAASVIDATADFYLATNNEGDTVIHVALKCKNNMEVVCELLGKVSRYPQIFKTVNNSGDTPLHLLVGHYSDPQIYSFDMFSLSNMFSSNFAMCLLNKEGFTPLLRAASNGNLSLVKKLIEHCPQSVEVCDFDGRNVLHLLKVSLKVNIELQEFITEPEIIILINAQDNNGDTPAHNAIENDDFVKFEVLSQSNADFTIKNKKGISVKDLIHKYSHQLCRAEVETEKTLFKVMNDMLFREAAYGKVESIAQSDEEDVFSRTEQGSSIIHIPTQNGQGTVVKEVLRRYPTLLLTRDLNGDNPLHISARYGHLAAKMLVHYCKECLEDDYLSIGVKISLEAKNLQGYTPLHKALRTGNIDIALDIINLNPDGWKNLLKDDPETPLHLLARYAPNSTNKLESITLLVKASEWAMFKRDSDGLTPLIRATQCGNILLAYVIARNYRSCIEFRDPKGRNFLHHLRLQLAEFDVTTQIDHLLMLCNKLLKISGVETLIYSRDYEGNTPVHLALMDQDFDIVRVLVKRHCYMAEPNTRKILMSIRNNDGKSVTNLINSCSHVPPNLKKLMEQATTERLLDETFVEASRNGDDGLFQKRRFISINKVIQKSDIADHEISREIHQTNVVDHHEIYKENQHTHVADHYTDNKIQSYQQANAAGFDTNKGKQQANVFDLDNIEENQEEANHDTNKDNDHQQAEDEYFLDQTLDGSNILHIAIREGHITFIEKALAFFPELIFQKDSNGDSAVHIAARLRTTASLKFLDLSCILWGEMRRDEQDKLKLNVNPAPWIIKNSIGNTLLHEAARTSNYEVLSTLLMHHKGLTKKVLVDVNDNGETLLHMVSRYAIYTTTDCLEIVEALIADSSTAAYIRDDDDLTPLLRAAYCGRLRIMNFIIKHHPQSLEMYDCKGKTILHHLRSLLVKHVEDSVDPLLLWELVFNDHLRVDKLRSIQDKDGNTPLHLAITNGDVAAAKFLMEKCFASENRQELGIFNYDGHSVFDLLSSQVPQPYIHEMKELKSIMSLGYNCLPEEMKTTKRVVKLDKLMDEKLYKAAIEGNASIFDEDSQRLSFGSAKNIEDDIESITDSKYEDAYFLTHAPDGSNIIHLAIKYSHTKKGVDHVAFIEKAIKLFPSLILESDTDGETPLHLAAKFKCDVLKSFTKNASDVVNKLLQQRTIATPGVFTALTSRRNSKGNMPIHEAIVKNST